jgi:AraC-like DNA-binding protein
MKKAHQIPLIHNSVLSPFILAAKKRGSPVEKILSSVGLPAQLLDDPDILLPMVPCWKFISEVNRREGLHDLGVQAANITPHNKISSLTPLIANCNNLFDLLKRFCLVSPLVSASADYTLEMSQYNVLFKQNSPRPIEDSSQGELFEIVGMIQLVNLATDYSWYPEEIYLTFKPNNVIKNFDFLGFSHVMVNQAYPAISIPRSMMALPILPNTMSNNLSENYIPDGFIPKVQQLITPYLSESSLSINTTAELIGTSVRTLQRRLGENSITFSELVTTTKMLQASSFLRKNEFKILEISLILGYKDASSFSRAFRHWAGVSPREYRQHNAISS